MARNTSTFTFKFTGRDQSVGSTLDGMERRMGGFGGFLNRWGGGIAATIGAAFAVDRLAGFASSLLNLGNQLTVWNVKVDTVFGDAAESVRRWADDINESLGLSDEEVAGLAASMGDLLVPIGATREQAAESSQSMIELAGALSAWSGGQYDASQVAEILTKAQLGERDSLKALGISINQAEVDQRALNLAKDEGRRAVTALDKAIATQQLILEKSTDAQDAWNSGAFDAIKNQNALKAAWADLKNELAEAFLPVATRLTGWLVNEALPALQDFRDWVGPKIRAALDRFSEWWDENGSKIVGELVAWRDNAKETFEGFAAVISDHAQPAVENMNDSVGGLGDSLNRLSESLGTNKDGWTLLGNVLGGVVVGSMYFVAHEIRRISLAVDAAAIVVGGLREGFERLVGWADNLKDGIDGVWESLGRLKDRLSSGWAVPGSPSIPSSWRDLVPDPVEDLFFSAGGNYFTKPSLTAIAEGGQPEFVFNAAQMRGLAAHGISLGANRTTEPQPAHVTNIYVTGSILSERDLIDVINRADRRGLVGAGAF